MFLDERREIWKDEKIYCCVFLLQMNDVWRTEVIFIYNETIEKSIQFD